jgi:hypothetical protein
LNKLNELRQGLISETEYVMEKSDWTNDNKSLNFGARQPFYSH